VGDRGSGRPTWAEIDLSALAHNLERLRARAPGRRVIAVVKANGYGHGAHVVGPALAGAGADALAVVTVAEAADLRAGGIERPILLLQGLHAADEADFAHELGLSVAVGRLDTIAALEAAAERAGRPVAVHLKFDTGMARLGFDAGDVDAVLDRVLGGRVSTCRA
jgi:alanine racemase